MAEAPFTIVLADDVRLELEIEKTFFQRRGYEVITASDGLTAFNSAVTEKPALVILDQVMPDLSGTDVCARLKANEQTRGIPVIIVSAHETEEVRRATRESGAHAFVAKSAGREHLLEVAAQILKVPARKSARLTVFFSVETEGEGKESLGKAVDLSEGGMGLEVNRLYDMGSSLGLRFMLPREPHQIRVTAMVRWAKQKGEGVYALGLEFTELPPMDRARLNRFLDRSFASGLGKS